MQMNTKGRLSPRVCLECSIEFAKVAHPLNVVFSALAFTGTSWLHLPIVVL